MIRLGAALFLAALSGCGSGYVMRTYERPPVEEAEAPEAEDEKDVPADGIVEEGYTVGEGETLETIAREKLGKAILWRHIYEWNKLAAPVSAGQRIVIPKHFSFLATGVVELPRRERVPRNAPPAGRRPESVFRPGEKLSYDVKWFALTAGQAYMEVRDFSQMGGRSCFHFVATAKSGLLFFFKVHDWIESYSTRDALLPQRFEKHLQEGRYKKDIAAEFDLEKMKVKWGEQAADLEPDTRDLLGAFYYFRTMKLPEMGGKVSVGVHTDKKNYELEVTVLRREVIRVPGGEFRTILIKPRLKFEGLWKQKGDILIWLTDDEARIPVLVVSKVFLLGSVDIVLTGMERP